MQTDTEMNRGDAILPRPSDCGGKVKGHIEDTSVKALVKLNARLMEDLVRMKSFFLKI